MKTLLDEKGVGNNTKEQLPVNFNEKDISYSVKAIEGKNTENLSFYYGKKTVPLDDTAVGDNKKETLPMDLKEKNSPCDAEAVGKKGKEKLTIKFKETDLSYDGKTAGDYIKQNIVNNFKENAITKGVNLFKKLIVNLIKLKQILQSF